MDEEIKDFFGEPISIYTSEQAEADGILIKTNHPLINYMTASVFHKCIEPFIINDNEIALTKKLIDSAIIEIKKQYLKANKQADWFYEFNCRGWKLWACQNETGRYTLMFPEDY